MVSSNYFTKKHDFSVIIQAFFKFHDFSMHGTFFSEFPGFPELVEPCNTLMADLCLCLSIQCFTKGVTLLRASNALMAEVCRFLSLIGSIL